LYDGEGYEVNEPLATKMLAQPHDARPFDLLNPEFRYYDYEFERYWHFFQVFGRIGYNPSTDQELWHKEFELRLGKKPAPYLEEALHRASWILPRIVASIYPYRGFPMTRGWAEKQRLGDLEQYSMNEGSDMQQFANFDEEARVLLGKLETSKLLPSLTGRWFKQAANEIDSLIAEAEKVVVDPENKEFISTVTDLKILSSLARYHSRRIPAAVNYRLFEYTKDLAALDASIIHERNAIEAWRQIIVAAGDIYAEDLMMGVRVADLSGHWMDELSALENGLNELELKRENLKSIQVINRAPKYHEPSVSDWNERFEIIHKPINSHPLGE